MLERFMIRWEIQTVGLSLLLIAALNIRKWKSGERHRNFETPYADDIISRYSNFYSKL